MSTVNQCTIKKIFQISRLSMTNCWLPKHRDCLHVDRYLHRIEEKNESVKYYQPVLNTSPFWIGKSNYYRILELCKQLSTFTDNKTKAYNVTQLVTWKNISLKEFANKIPLDPMFSIALMVHMVIYLFYVGRRKRNQIDTLFYFCTPC